VVITDLRIFDELILSKIIEDIQSKLSFEILVVSGDPGYSERIHGVKGSQPIFPGGGGYHTKCGYRNRGEEG
jgi:hypothetical protein